MKGIVNRRQGASDTQSVLTKMQTMFTKFLEQPPGNSAVIAAAAPAPGPSATEKKLDKLSSDIKTLQKQQQQMQASYAMAAYDQAPGPSRPCQTRIWQGQHTNQVDQLQQQVNCLESELRRYQNPREVAPSHFPQVPKERKWRPPMSRYLELELFLANAWLNFINPKIIRPTRII